MPPFPDLDAPDVVRNAIRKAMNLTLGSFAVTSIDIDDDIGATADAEGDIATVAVITDNGGGAAADGTIAAITLTEPANLAAQTVINNQLADAVKELSTKINALKAAYDINFSTLAAQYNALRADLLAAKAAAPAV